MAVDLEKPLSQPHIEPLKEEAPPSSSFENSVVVASEESKELRASKASQKRL